jgi:aminoglycoside phosphotransferase (APT) family kinase protein
MDPSGATTERDDGASEIAVLEHFAIGPADLLGSGGEAKVFALDAGRVLRLPHQGVPAADQVDRARFLDHLRTGDAPFALPEVLDRLQVHGRTVVIERRLPGTDSLGALGRLSAGRATLVRSHLDATTAIAGLPCPATRFGEIWGAGAIRARSFAEWSAARLVRSLESAPADFRHVDAGDVTGALLRALDRPEADDPVVVHLDAYLGNMVCEGDQVSAVLDFGATTIGGPRDLDPAVAIAYLAPEITPTATDEDRATALAWADEHGLVPILEPARRWIACYWSAAVDDHALQQWCRRVLLT